MSAHKKTLEERLADCIRRLASDKDGDVLAAAHGMLRILQSAGTDIHGLAHAIENLGKSAEVSKDQMKKIWDQAVQHTENRLHGADDFVSTDGKPRWEQVALFCQRNKGRLNPRTYEFVDKMAAQTVFGREPTEKQHKYLFALFLQLGGKII
jgi:hypothetical protein